MGFDAASALQDPAKAPTLRKSLSLKEQQKALIEQRKLGGNAPLPGLPLQRDVPANQNGNSAGVTTRGKVNTTGQPKEEDVDMFVSILSMRALSLSLS